MNNVQKLIELGGKLPRGLESDWDGSNHFELQAPYSNGYFWLCLRDLNAKSTWLDCDNEEGQKVGLIMDIAAALRAALPELRELLEPAPKQE